MSSHEQLVRFAELNGRRVAWAAVGEGPPMVMGGWWMSHLELDWGNRRFRDFITALARYRTVVRYDPPGTGLSDRDGPPPMSLDDEVEVLAAVVRAVGAESVVVFAGSAGGPIAARYAAEHPRQVERLVLYGSYLNGAAIADPAAREMLINLIRRHWGLGSRVLADVFMPSATAAERDEFVAFQRESAPAELAARSLEATYTFNVEDCRRPDSITDRGSAPKERPSDPVRARSSARRPHPRRGVRRPRRRRSSPLVRGRRSRGAGSARIRRRRPARGRDRATGRRPAGCADTDLSARELEVLRLVAEGLSDAEIAERLVLSPHTVHRHVANIRTKLGLASRAAAAAHAARLGLL